MTELTVSVRGDEGSFKMSFLLYEKFVWEEDDPVIKRCVDETLASSTIEPNDIKVRALIQYM